MESYINDLKAKYENLIREISKSKSRDNMGNLIAEISEIADSKGVKSSKAEIRDALIALASSGEIKIEKHPQKRFEVTFFPVG